MYVHPPKNGINMYWSISTCTYTLSTLVVIGWGCFPQPVMFCYENGTGQISSLWVNGWRSSMLDIFGRTINPSSPTILYNPYMRAFRKLPILRRIIDMYIYIYIYTCMYGMIWFCFCLVKLIQQPKHAQNPWRLRKKKSGTSSFRIRELGTLSGTVHDGHGIPWKLMDLDGWCELMSCMILV